ncbi:MAG: hypothetical protein IJM39_06945 [Firmicutes bacterium]|nr:hypothetical protein [Bacillota bacterium]
MRTKRILLILLALAMILLAAGCGQKDTAANNNTDTTPKAPIADGVYSADFKTDSTMFHVNEAYKGKGTLTVKDGRMVIHVTLASKSIVNLFPGTAEDAQKDGAKLLQPTTDSVKYSDGTTDEAYGFDIEVPFLNDEFDCAILGSKGKWYDHKVSVSNPELLK